MNRCRGGWHPSPDCRQLGGGASWRARGRTRQAEQEVPSGAKVSKDGKRMIKEADTSL